MITTRRTALKAITAALMCPTIKLRDDYPDERLLRQFCNSDEHYRYDHSTPYSVGSLSYATDARVLVRAELPSVQTIGERVMPPIERVWKLWWTPSPFTPNTQWVPLEGRLIVPTIRQEEYSRCPVCNSVASVQLAVYPGSEEELEALKPFGWDVDSNSIRDRNCPECHGLEFKGNHLIQIHHTMFSAYYMRKLATLPNAEICLDRTKTVLLVRAEAFQGILMSVEPGNQD